MPSIDSGVLNQIEHTVGDLLSAEYNTFDRPIKKLSRLLHSPDLEPTTCKLTDGIDLESWVNAGMAGRAGLEWPAEHEKQLGIVLLLIDRFSENGDAPIFSAPIFSHHFYRVGNRPTDDLRNMVRQIVVPFARDYIIYVRAQAAADATPPKQADLKPPEVLSLKPAIYGIGIDLKEAWRRLCAWREPTK